MSTIQMPTVFSTTKFPATAISWTLNLTDMLTPLRGTLELLGTVSYTVGNNLTVDGRQYKITNVTHNKSGTRVSTTVTVRDSLYELLVTTAPTAIAWITAPRRIIRQETITNIEMPNDTKLCTREGDTFGVGGWRMSEIASYCANLARLGCSYSIPDFWVKQLTLERFQPILEFLQSVLNPFMPRLYVVGSTLMIQPFKSYSASAMTAPAAESFSASTTYAEPYKELRVWGGSAKFKRDKWEGKTLLSSGSNDFTVYMNKIVGDVTTYAQEGTRIYWQTFTDGVVTTKVKSVYSKDIFGNDAFLLGKEEWRFTKKVPDYAGTNDDLQTVMTNLRDSVIEEGADSVPWPTMDDYYLDSCEKTVNVYAAYSYEWEQPVLITTHRSIWKYLWWDDRALPSPGTAPGLLAAYPSTIQPTRLGLEYLEGETPDVTGVWSNEAFYERADYNYEYTEEDSEGVVGGLLQSKTLYSFGVRKSNVPNLDDLGEPTAPKGDFRYIPAYENNHPTPGFGYDSVLPYMRIAMEVETYKEASLRTVVKTRTTSKVDINVLTWWDEQGNLADEASNPAGYTQYRVDSTQELIPIKEAPQTMARKRGMRCYDVTAGKGRRVAEIDIPLIVSWTDLDTVAAMLKQVHTQNNSICTRTVVVPGRFEITGAIVGGKLTVPGETTTGRIVAASYTALGSGEHTTQFVLQNEEG